MPTLQIQLLGNFHLRMDGSPITPFKQKSLQSLLASLMLQPTIPLATHTLATFLWPELPLPDAQTNLLLLHQELIHALPLAKALLWVTPEQWRWHPQVHIESDVATFEEAVARAAQTQDPKTARKHLEDAIALYSGDFLPTSQEHWVATKRAELHHLWLTSLRQLLHLQEQQGDTLAALASARRIWQHDPLFEHEYQRLIHLHVLQGERANALAALQHRLYMALRGQGGIVFLEGAAGIGKTSLALACQKQAKTLGATFVLSHGYERGAATPFSLWQEALAALITASGLTAQMPEPFGTAPPPSSIHSLLNVVATWLHRVAHQQPLVLLLDDIHWADPDSLALLEVITRRIEQTPLFLIATYRAEEIDRYHPLHDLLPILRRNSYVERIRLLPLNVDDTARLVEAHLGPCTSRLATYLHSRAEGHPLFLVELLKDLIERKLVTQGALGRWLPPLQPVALPEMLTHLIAGRVLRLGANAEMLLAVASVVGEQWELSIVEAILDWPEETLLAVLEQVLAARLIILKDETAEQYQFTHGLIREVLYQQQVIRRRKHLHAQIRAILEARIPPQASTPARVHAKHINELAHHSYHAQQWDKALRYNLAAGENAGRRSAGRSALQYYEQALEAVQHLAGAADPQQVRYLHERIDEIHTRLNHKEAETAQATPFPAGLTAREVDVLQLIAQGATNRQIATTLTISVKTVDAHVANILSKIGCDNRTAAAAFALQHNLLP